MEFLKDWLALAALVVSLGTTVYAWLTSRSKGNAEHLKAVDAALLDHGSRIQSIESEMKHMPAKDDVVELKLALAEIKGQMGRFDESLSGVSRTVRRMEEFLLKEGK